MRRILVEEPSSGDGVQILRMFRFQEEDPNVLNI
jgi:hypothetical protein